MRVLPPLFVLALSCLSARASDVNLYVINPFRVSNAGSAYSGSLPFGLRTLNPLDIQQGSILILTPDFDEQPDTKVLHAFFVPNGMSSLNLNSKFKSLYNSFLQFKLSGLVLYPGSYSNSIFSQSKIIDVTIPDTFNATELLHFFETPSIPVVYIAPTDIFNCQSLFPLNRFAVYSFQPEEVVLSESFGTFYYPVDQGNVGPLDVNTPYHDTRQQVSNQPASETIGPKYISETEVY